MVSVKKHILLPIITLFALACSSDSNETDCSLVPCEANELIRLEFLIDGTNPLSDETYSIDEVSVIGKTMEPIEVAIRTNTGGATGALLEIISPDWDSETYFYTVELGADWSIPIEVRFTKSKSNDPCCAERLEILSLVSSRFQVEGQIGFYSVILE